MQRTAPRTYTIYIYLYMREKPCATQHEQPRAYNTRRIMHHVHNKYYVFAVSSVVCIVRLPSRIQWSVWRVYCIYIVVIYALRAALRIVRCASYSQSSVVVGSGFAFIMRYMCGVVSCCIVRCASCIWHIKSLQTHENCF